jgi:hypothetical protein
MSSLSLSLSLGCFASIVWVSPGPVRCAAPQRQSGPVAFCQATTRIIGSARGERGAQDSFGTWPFARRQGALSSARRTRRPGQEPAR